MKKWAFDPKNDISKVKTVNNHWEQQGIKIRSLVSNGRIKVVVIPPFEIYIFLLEAEVNFFFSGIYAWLVRMEVLSWVAEDGANRTGIWARGH